MSSMYVTSVTAEIGSRFPMKHKHRNVVTGVVILFSFEISGESPTVQQVTLVKQEMFFGSSFTIKEKKEK